MKKRTDELMFGLDFNSFIDVIKLLLKGESPLSTAEKCRVEIEKVNWIRSCYLNLGQ